MNENYDDVLFAADESEHEDSTPTTEFDPEVYRERKQQERDAVYTMIDDAALSLAAPEKLKEYLDIQSRFDLYRPGNVLLIQAQMPMAARLKTYEEWKRMGAGIRRGEHPISIMKSGKQFARDDGSIGQFTDIKKVFDISQTFSAPKTNAPTYPEGRSLIKVLMSKIPVPAKAHDNLPEGVGAYYDNAAKVVYVRPGMDAPDIFRCMSVELAHAEFARSQGNEYRRDNSEFAAYCASYVLCREYGVDVSGFNFDNAPAQFEGREPKDIRADLADIREAAGEIGGRMKQAVQQERSPKEQEDVAR